jgi:hypothetical protein
MCSASFGTVPERSRAPRGGGRNSPASGEYLPPRTLDGEDPFRILVAQGKGAASSSLPQADSSFRLPPRSVCQTVAEFSSYIHCRPRLSSLSLPPGFHTHSICGLMRSPVQVGIRLKPGAVHLRIDLTRCRVVSRDRAVARISAKTNVRDYNARSLP